MRYHDVVPISKEEAQSAFQGEDSERICDALVRIAYHDPDWKWVQEQCIRFSRHADPDVRGLALTCFGHLARIHQKLDLLVVMPILEEALNDPIVGGRAGDALDDIEIYLQQES